VVDVTASRLARACYVVSLFLVLSGIVHLAVFFIDDRPWAGPLSWRKPFTFGLSFGLTLATVTWLSSYLRITEHTRTVLLSVFAVDCVVEVSGITLQAWRDQPSHLNTSTPFNASVAYMLAAGGAVLVLTLGVMAVVAVLGRTSASPSMALALRAGFLLLMAGLASGAAMIARGTVAMRTGPAERAYQLTGFLKGFHGVTLHGVLVLPALAWLLARTHLSERSRVRAVVAAVAVYGLAASAVLVWNLSTA
jgi:hypothetical protein